MVQHELAWHTEQLYEFTMKTRTNKLILRDFINKFEAYNLENNDNIKQKVEWLIDFIKQIKYVSFLTLKSHVLIHTSCLLLQKPSGYS